MIKITFPDKREKDYPEGITGLEIARSISPRLAKEVLSIEVNNETWDLTREITTDSKIKLFKWDDEEGKQRQCPYRQSCEHCTTGDEGQHGAGSPTRGWWCI